MRRTIASLMLVVGVWVCPETAWGQSGKNGSTVPPPPGSTSGKQSQPASQFGVKSVKSTKSGVSLPVKGDPFSGSGLPVHHGSWTNAVFRWIPPGTFQMGSTAVTDPDRYDDETPHMVTLTQGFWMLDHEVTRLEFWAITGITTSRFSINGHRPVERITWDEAVKFCKELTKKDREAGRIAPNQEYRLPTEAEWEYACRAGTTGAVYVDYKDRYKELDAVSWWDWNSGGQTHDVKQKLPNAFGLYDMLGNVRERCSDWYGVYPSGDVTDPKGPDSGPGRVQRGGSYYDDDRHRFRSASRAYSKENTWSAETGFRPVLSPAR